jgi:hypothetical protein
MANGRPGDDDSVGDDLEIIEFVTEEPTLRPEPEAVGNDRRPRRRRHLVLALAAVVVAIVGVSVAVSRDDGDAEAEPGNRGTTSASRTAPDVPPPTVLPMEERPPPTSPGDATTTAPLLPEGAPSTPDVGELIASVADFASGGTDTAYYFYADGRLIRSRTQADGGSSFVEQRLTPAGIERVRSEFLVAWGFDPNPPPGNISDCTYGICVRGNDGRLRTAPESGRTAIQMTRATRLVTFIRALDESLPETEWVAPRIRTYIPARIAVCLQTFANVPDRAIGMPLDLSVLVPTFPARAAELLDGRAPIGGRPNPDPACFEMTLDEARTLADEFLSPAGGGSHLYSGIVVNNRQLAEIRTGRSEGIVAFVKFNTLLPHPESAGLYGG